MPHQVRTLQKIIDGDIIYKKLIFNFLKAVGEGVSVLAKMDLGPQSIHTHSAYPQSSFYISTFMLERYKSHFFLS